MEKSSKSGKRKVSSDWSSEEEDDMPDYNKIQNREMDVEGDMDNE